MRRPAIFTVGEFSGCLGNHAAYSRCTKKTSGLSRAYALKKTKLALSQIILKAQQEKYGFVASKHTQCILILLEDQKPDFVET